ncbi:MAG TPA: Fe-S cluster assembly protein SufD [Gaiellaceae bacterium]
MSRAEALERYRELPLPDTTEEHWRFTDLRGFDPDSFGQDQGTVPRTTAARAMLDLDVAGLATITEAGVEIERAPEGVIFEPLSEDHARLYSLVGWDEKFAAHNAAVWQHGLLVHVPKGVELDKPLYVRVTNSAEDAALFWRLLVIADPGARFALVEEVASSAPDLRSYTNAAVELFVEQGAKLEYVSLQNLSRETWHFASQHARVERDAELDWVTGGFGSKKGKVRIQNDLAGEGATSQVTGAYFTDGNQHLDYDTFQEHIAPSTTSDFAFKGALRDTSTAVWRGMIRVERDAQKTNAYQENRNLMLSPTAHAVPIPGLEILANDVRCTHGATVGRVDREQLFYLMARGLSRGEAERLIVRGFFEDVLARVGLDPVREALAAALEARIPHS